MSEHERAEQDEGLEQPVGEAQPVVSGEVMPYAPPVANRTVDLRNVATDSWTDVLADVVTLSRGIAGTEFVPAGLRGSMEKTTAAILYGRELGLPPMTALGSIHVIDGRAGTSAESMRALILQAGHELEIREMTTSRCRIAGRRRGSESWTEAVAAKAEFDQVRIRTRGGSMKLTEKDNWRNWPAEMLLARATTRLARMMFADVIHGMRSTEELSDMTETGQAPAAGRADAGQVPAPAGRTRVARKRKPHEPRQAAAPAESGPAAEQPQTPERRRKPLLHPGRDGRTRHADRRPGRLASEERTESARNHPYR